MKLYIVYTTATGEIVKVGVCGDNDIDSQAAVGQTATEGIADDMSYRVTTNSVKAVGTITMSGVAVEDETFVIDTNTFTWKTLRGNPLQVTLGESASEAVTNLVAAINEDMVGIVSAADGAGDTVVVTAVHAGIGGNSIDFTESCTNMSMNGGGHLGGTTSGANVVLTEKNLITGVATWDKTIINANGTDAATLGAGLPNPTIVKIMITQAEGAESVDSFTVADGSLVFKSDIVGIYDVTVSADNYKDYSQTIIASLNPQNAVSVIHVQALSTCTIEEI